MKHRGARGRLSVQHTRKNAWRTKELLEHLEPRLLLTSLVSVLTNHGDAGSTGQNLGETILTPVSIASSQGGSSITTNFGRLFDTSLDGQVYAQPLAVAGVNITRGASLGLHNVVYVATMHNSLYAIDQETGAILWQDNFNNITDPTNLTATAGVRTIPAGGASTTPVQPYNALVNGNDVGPEIGILATPTIDASTNILYLVDSTREMRNGATASATGTDTHFVQRLWAVNLADGTVAITVTDNPPTTVEPATTGKIIGDTWKTDVTATSGTFSNYTNYKYIAGPFIKGSGNNNDTYNADGTVATTNNADGWVVNAGDTTSPWGAAGKSASQTGYIAFNALLQMNRVATTLINGEIYLGFASHGDDGPYYGFLLGYNAATLSNNAAFVTVPTFDGVKGSAGFTSVGGLWGSGGGISTDGTYLYFTVGNGSFNNAASNFNANYFSLNGTNHVQLPLDGDYGDTVLKVALDMSATQTNVNLKNTAAGVQTPDGTYNPDGGYNATGYGMKVVDFFAPSNVRVLNVHDEDLGSGGLLLIPTTGPGAATAPNGDQMLVTAGKEGRIYLLDAGNLGGFNTAYVTDGHDVDSTTNAGVNPAPYDRVLGEYYYRQANGNPTIVANDQTNKGYQISSYFNGVVYFGLSGGTEDGITVANLLFPSGPTSSRTATYSALTFSSSVVQGSRGVTATITGNGTSNAIIWNDFGNQSSTDALVAYDPTAGTGAGVIFSSNWTILGQGSNTSDTLTNGVTGATGAKFSIPTVVNGLVYVGTGGGSSSSNSRQLGTITGYGLLNPILHVPGTPTASGTNPNLVHLGWSLTSGDQESEVLVQRSTDGTNFTTVAILGNGATSYDDAAVVSGTHYTYRVEEVYGTAANTKVSATVGVTVQGLLLNGVASRKPEGAGTLDVTVFLVGNPIVEPRVGGPTQLVFTFNENVTLPGSFSLGLTSGTGTASVSGNVVTVNMSGATNNEVLTVSLNNVQDPNGNLSNFSAQLKPVVADSDGNGQVNIVDLQTVANNWQQPVSGPAQGDFNGDGVVDIRDLQTLANNWQVGVGGGGGSGSGSGEQAVSSASENLAPATTNTLKVARPEYIPPVNSPASQRNDTDPDNNSLGHHSVKKWKIVLSKISVST